MNPAPSHKSSSLLLLIGLATFWMLAIKGIAQEPANPSEYQKLQERMARGWNTWNGRSVLSQVLLPEGFAINVGLKEYKAGRYLKESLVGRYQQKTDPQFDYRGGEPVEVVTPGDHAYDGSYTSLHVAWRGIEADVQTATLNDDLVILVTPTKNQRYPATLVFESGILWNREGSIERQGEEIVAKLPRRQIHVFTTKSWISDPYIATQTPYAAMAMTEEIGLSTGKRRSVDEIKAIIERKKQQHVRNRAKYGELSEAYHAMQSCLAWETVYEPKKDRVITTVSRVWGVERNFGGYLLAWDVFMHAYIAAFDYKDLAYSDALSMLKERVPAGFVPFGEAGSGFDTLDKTCPPVGSILIRDLYRKFGDKWVLQESFDDLLAWNRWLYANRQIADGLFAWGTNPVKPIYDNFFESHSVDELFGAKLESGEDNLNLWDDVTFNHQKHMMEYADVGFTSLYIADCDALAEIADTLGKGAEAAELRERGQKSKTALKGLWDESTGMFLNKHTDTGKLSSKLAPSNFYPLLAGVATQQQAERMVKEHLCNPNEFWGEWMIPCAPRNDPAYKDQYYWRGRIWAPTNYLVYLGLKKYGMTSVQKALAEKSGKLILKDWLQSGYVHENYNSNLGTGSDDSTESEKFYTWSGLFGVLPLIEAGN